MRTLFLVHKRPFSSCSLMVDRKTGLNLSIPYKAADSTMGAPSPCPHSGRLPPKVPLYSLGLQHENFEGHTHSVHSRRVHTMEHNTVMRISEVHVHTTPHHNNFQQKQPDIRIYREISHVYKVHSRQDLSMTLLVNYFSLG